MTKVWNTQELTDKDVILNYLQKDRLYAAYAIGDLEPYFFAQSKWIGAEEAGRLKALVLTFSGLKQPALFLMGDVKGLRVILENARCPEHAYITCREEHLAMARDFYTWNRSIPMWRMVLDPMEFKAKKGNCVRLTSAHSKHLTELYSLGGGIGFSTTQVHYGIFFGIFVERKLIAVAGTHLISENYGVAAVGNVFTHPDFRGQGYGTVTSNAVVLELLEMGIPDVILNVGQDNSIAIRIYERLGFKNYCPYFEGPARIRGINDQHQ